jgi:hypothetical protein
MLFRQGDIYIEAVRTIPAGAIKKDDLVLAEGEVTGHSHRVRDFRSAVVYAIGDELFVNVTAERAEIVHEEHGTIELNRGIYRVWRQREYEPAQNLWVNEPLPNRARRTDYRYVVD